ncbi:hypothetical protein LSAT2_027947, partial [Lamellibrachia satsuma]
MHTRTPTDHSMTTQNVYILPSDDDNTSRESLSTQSFSSQDGSISPPQRTSSPIFNTGPVATPHPKPIRNTFRVLTVNFQSIKAKRTSLLLSEVNPDIVTGSETGCIKGSMTEKYSQIATISLHERI